LTPRGLVKVSVSGIGITTGLHTAYSIEGAVIVDNPAVFDYVKTSLEKAISERPGTPGFRSIAGEFHGTKIALVLIPPYPQAVAEAATELYMLGAKKIILVGRGQKLTRRVESNILLANGAIPRDSVSGRIARPGLPLLASQQLLSKAKSLGDVRFPDVKMRIGLTVTIDSMRLKWTLNDAEDLVGMKAVVGVDSLVAPLYALQYEYNNLETLAIITMFRNYTRVPTLIETSAEVLQKVAERETRTANILYMLAAETIHSVLREATSRG